MMAHKVCIKCNTEKLLEYFGKRPESKDGYRLECKLCVSIRTKAWAQQNKDKIKQASKEYRAKNKSKIAEDKKSYALRNKGKLKIRLKEYYQVHSSQIKERTSKYKKKNKAKVNELAQRREARKLKQSPELSPVERAKVVILYNIAKIITYKLKIPMHVDHIIPLAKGGLHHPTNLQVITAKENTSKQDTLPANLSQEIITLHNTFYNKEIYG